MNIYAPTTDKNPATCLQIDVRHFKKGNRDIDDKYLINVSKRYKKDESMAWCDVNSIPITELHQEFKDVFSNFDENRFVSYLTHNIFRDINNNLITTYTFKQTESHMKKIDSLRKIATNAILNDEPVFPLTKEEMKLINEPIELKSNLDKAPNGYELIKIYSKQFTPEFLNKINNPQAKVVNTNDIIYLLNYIKHCI